MFSLAALMLGSFLLMLLTHFSMKVWSDPAQWFVFGSSFSERFGSTHLAYGFPWVLFLAVRWVGPYHGFLVNIPILVLLLVGFMVFVSVSLGRNRRPAWLTTLAAAGIFILMNRDMLVVLASPYRDPLSFLFLLGAATLCVRAMPPAGKTRWGSLALGALCLAFAVSCRETTGLLVVPLGLYILAAGRPWTPRRFCLVPLVFGVFLLLGCLPWLVQNYIVSGNPMVPAQSARQVAKAASVAAILPTHPAGRVPLRTLLYLWHHYTPAGVVAIGLGIAWSLRRKVLPLHALCLPSAAVFILFYMLYYKIVPRYLLVVDLFAIPLLAFGCIETVRWATRWMPRRSMERAFAAAAVVLTLSLCWWMLASGPKGRRFLPQHARDLVETIDQQLPRDAAVLCERPLEGILQCFSHTRARPLLYLGRRRVLRDRTTWTALRERIESGPVYLASLSTPFRDQVRREFDLAPELELDTARYHLDSWFMTPTIEVARLKPWSSTSTSSALAPNDHPPGQPLLLELDLGHLSAYPRRRIDVRLSGEVLDHAPVDNRNYYWISASSVTGRSQIVVSSDGAVPDRLSSRVMPGGGPIVMDVRGDELAAWQNRFSEAWLSEPRDNYPSIIDSGGILLPTPGTGAAWAAVMLLKSYGEASAESGYTIVTARAGEQTLAQSRLPANGRWKAVPMYLPPRLTDRHNLSVALKSTPERSATPQRIWLRKVVLKRMESTLPVTMHVGTMAYDALHLDTGFHKAEEGPRGRYRWTKGKATLFLFVPPVDGDCLLRISYLDARPQPAASLDLTCLVNGEPVRDASIEEEEGLNVWTGDLPAGLLREGVNLLTLQTGTWVPARTAEDSDDRRELGVQIYRVELSGG